MKIQIIFLILILLILLIISCDPSKPAGQSYTPYKEVQIWHGISQEWILDQINGTTTIIDVRYYIKNTGDCDISSIEFISTLKFKNLLEEPCNLSQIKTIKPGETNSDLILHKEYDFYKELDSVANSSIVLN
jgi:hypothetical protein